MIPDWLYETSPNGFWVFLLLTVILGGAAAYGIVVSSFGLGALAGAVAAKIPKKFIRD